MDPLRCNHQGAFEVERELPENYTCAACAQFGYGPCCTCGLCGSRLHVDCAFHEDAITRPFFPSSVLRFRPSVDPSRRCDACGRDIDGYVYQCPVKGYDLHPTCASLRNVIHVPDMEIATLFLRKTMSSACCKSGKELGGGSRPFRSWGYESSRKEYCLHVSCANDILMEVQLGNRRGQEPGVDRAPSPLEEDSITHAFFPGSVFTFQRTIRAPGMEAPLVLRRSMSSKCAWCESKKPKRASNYWCYEWGREEYHVYCAKEMLAAAGEGEGTSSSERELRLDLSYAAPAGVSGRSPEAGEKGWKVRQDHEHGQDRRHGPHIGAGRRSDDLDRDFYHDHDHQLRSDHKDRPRILCAIFYCIISYYYYFSYFLS